jgi:hypothetical protein
MQAVEDLIPLIDIASDHIAGMFDDPRPKDAKKVVVQVQKSFDLILKNLEKALGPIGRRSGHVRHIQYRLGEALKELQGNRVVVTRDHLNAVRDYLRDFDKALNAVLG